MRKRYHFPFPITCHFRNRNALKLLSFLAFLFQLFNTKPLFAQNVNTYDFAASNGTFTPIVVGSGATAVPAIKADDAVSGALPIGFTFNYAGGNYTSVYASSNGFLTFSNASASSLPPYFANSTPLTTASTNSLAIIAPLVADLNWGNTSSQSEASYQTTGSAGSRVFTFQWLKWRWGVAGTNYDPDISFQVKLYEGSDKIEYYYKHESLNTAVYWHASIGLAGPASGSPDFLAVNYLYTPQTPPSSFTVEGRHNVRPVTGQIYTFTKSALKDMQAVDLAYPLATTCGANVPVTITVKNIGAVPLDFSVTPLTVSGSITGPNPLPNPSVTINTGTLGINATMDVVLAANYNMTAAGTYTFNATANLTGDGRPNNNSMPAATRSVAPIATIPQHVNFNGFDGTNLNTLSPGWDVAPAAPGGTIFWGAETGLGTANNGTAFLRMRDSGNQGWIKGPKITVNASTELRFKAAITEGFTLDPYPLGMAGTDDKVQVMVSTDCGTSFSPIFTFDATTSGNLNGQLLEQPPISLGAYAGQTIILGFYATDGSIDDTNSYRFHLDDISIAAPLPTDLGVTTIINPVATGCYSNAENVTVTIKNFGSNAIDFSTKSAQVQASVTVTGNPTPTLLTTSLTTGTLAPGATKAVNLPTLNMLAAGVHTFKLFTTIAGDNNTLNDTLTIFRYNAPTFALPNSVDFTGVVGFKNNFSALFPGWRHTTGIKPQTNPVNPSYWGDWTGLGQPANKTGIVQLWDNQVKAWLISPKIAATSITEFRFKVAITEYPNNNPYPLGMSGTDDSVKVMISTNCGVSFSPVYALNASNSGFITNVLNEIVIPLGAYAGQDIIIGIYATDGAINNTNNYLFHIDDLVLRNAYPIDVTPVKAVTKMSGCGLTTTEQICVVVKNESLTAQSNIPVSFRVGNGPVISEVIPGPIQPMDTLRYCFTGTANFAANGTYNLEIFTGLTTDVNMANDTIQHTVISYTPVALTSTTGDTRCGTGPVTLTATAPNNLPINWYTAATGGTLVGSGPTFTPTVSATTTFYAGAVTGIEKVGKQANTDNLKAGAGGGLYFDVSQTFDLKSVVVYTDIAAGGTITIHLKDASHTSLQIKSFTLPPVSGKTAVTVPLDFNNIAPGSDYRLILFGGSLQLYRDQTTTANPVFPIVSPSQTVTITGGNFSNYYNYFYDWTIAACSSSQREPVIAIVNPAPAVNLGPNITQCSTAPVLLDAGNAGATFQWSLNGTAIPGATSQTYSATTTGSYAVTVTNPNSCSTTGTVQVNFNAVATPTVTAAGPLTFCQGGSVSLTGVTTTAGVTYQWLLNNAPVTGATSANLNVNAPGNYRLVASLSGCSDTSAITTVTVNAKPAMPTITLASGSATICQGDSVTLNGASSTTGVSYRWSLNGTPIAGATSASYTASQPGAYRVTTTTAAGCADSSAVTTITVNPKPATPTITKTGTTLTASPTSGTYQWYAVSGTTLTPVSGATAATFIPTANGSYTVVVTENGCESDAATATSITLGVGSLALGMDISVFPNPTSGRFLLALTGFEKDASIQVLNVTGQEVASEKIAITSKEKTTKALDLSGMAKGVYILKITSGNNLTFRKIILE